jgi:hypothetical protein
VKARDMQSGCDRVRAQPAEAQLIGCCQKHDDRRSNCDFRISKSELDSRVRGLTCLGARWKVGTGNDTEPTGLRALTMRHVLMLADRQPLAPAAHS